MPADTTGVTATRTEGQIERGRTRLLRRRSRTDAPPSGTSEGRAPGDTLVAEATTALAEHRWRDARRAAEAAERLRGPSAETDRVVAVTAAHLGRRRAANAAVARLRAIEEPTVDDLDALALVGLARRDFGAADRLARRMIDADRERPEPWGVLAASFAGLGWFDEANECLDTAEELGIDEPRTWHVGRAVNQWALDRTWATAIGAFFFYFLGLLAIAIAITIPFLVRESRLARLDDRLASLAADAWRGEVTTRLMHLFAVLVIVGAWIAVLIVT